MEAQQLVRMLGRSCYCAGYDEAGEQVLKSSAQGDTPLAAAEHQDSINLR